MHSFNDMFTTNGIKYNQYRDISKSGIYFKNVMQTLDKNKQTNKQTNKNKTKTKQNKAKHWLGLTLHHFVI